MSTNEDDNIDNNIDYLICPQTAVHCGAAPPVWHPIFEIYYGAAPHRQRIVWLCSKTKHLSTMHNVILFVN
ncbi:unnamed protein product [Arctia plantaginis]|uniref:Uncharacterized protein n=1 Tax=Arctia plantaginis TaxID=874455 RepID=A0A8S0ZL38_ARCPL|nr:unnamed protein product [Arctia plantaginis]